MSCIPVSFAVLLVAGLSIQGGVAERHTLGLEAGGLLSEHAGDAGHVSLKPPVSKEGEQQPGSPSPHQKKRVLGGYGQMTMKHLKRWWQLAAPWTDGPVVMKCMFWILVILQVLGPFVLYWIMCSLLFSSTTLLRQKSELAEEIAQSLTLPLKFVAWFVCLDLGVMLLTSGVDKDFPMLVNIEDALNALTAVAVLIIPLRIVGHVDSSFEATLTQRLTSSNYLERKERMNRISHPTNSVQSFSGVDEHGSYLFKYLWRPFYYGSVIILSIAILLCITGNQLNAYFLGVSYFMMTLVMAVFGSHTLGPDIFGGLVLFLEKPFVEGDIITLDKPAGGRTGGAKTSIDESVVTGFVESIGLRAVTVRRFDMRLVTVPNTLFAKGAIANWNSRPRKLIHMNFAVSHRTSVDICSIFHEKVLYLAKNHHGVDPSQYIKAAFKSLDAGLTFELVCFNAQGHKKQVVQQDLVFKIAEIARNLKMHLVFEYQSLDVRREEGAADEFHINDNCLEEEQRQLLLAKLNQVLPGKREKTTAMTQYSSEGEIVIRLEKVILLQSFCPGSMDSDALPKGKTVGKKAYQLQLRPEDTSVCPEILSRKVVANVDASELRFCENVGLLLQEEENVGSCAKIPCTVEVCLLELSKGLESLIYNKPEWVGSVTVNVVDFIKRQYTQQAQALDLQDAAGKQVGTIHLQIYVPESIFSKLIPVA